MRIADAIGLRIDGQDAIEARLNGQVVWSASPPEPELFRFGNQSEAETTNLPNSNGRMALSRFELTQAGSLLRMAVRFSAGGSNGDPIKLLVYSDNAGSPQHRLAVSNVVNVAGVPAWQVAELPAPVPLSVGFYWLGFISDGFGGRSAQNGQTGMTMHRRESANYANPVTPYPGPSGTYANTVLQVWAELQA